MLPTFSYHDTQSASKQVHASTTSAFNFILMVLMIFWLFLSNEVNATDHLNNLNHANTTNNLNISSNLNTSYNSSTLNTSVNQDLESVYRVKQNLNTDSLGLHSQYHLSPENLGINEVLALPSNQWHPNTQDVPSFSLIEGDIWLRIALKNTESQAIKRILHLDYALLDQVEIYYQYDDEQRFSNHFRTGSIYPFKTRPISDSAFAFPVNLEAKQSLTLYLRLQNDGFIQAPITLWEELSFYEDRLISQSILFSVIGILAALGIYNIFLFLSVNEKTYLLFAFIAISTSILVSISSGLSIQYLGLDLHIWNEKWMTICLGVMTIASAFLPIVAMQLKTRSRIYYNLCIAMAFLGGWIILSSFLLDHSTRISIAFTIILFTILVITLLSFHFWFTKVPGVRLFAVSWSLFLFGGTLMIFNRLNLLPRNDSTEYLLVYTALSGLFLLSFSLANRINRAKQSQEEAQSTSLKLMEKFYDLFQNALEGIFTITAKGELIEANPAFCHMLGYQDIDHLKNSIINNQVFSPNDLINILKIVSNKGEVKGYELKGRRLDGSVFWAAVYVRKEKSKNLHMEVLSGAMLDITESKESQLKLEYLAEHDPLTGLHNRRKLMSALEDAIQGYRDNQLQSSVIYIDLDQFKVVNDTCGHTAGDNLLKDLTKTMSALIPLGSCLARLGGDEFAIVLSGYDDGTSYHFAENMRQTISDYQFTWDDHVFSLGASIGIVSINNDCNTVEYVLSLADTACFAAKDQGRNSIHIYDHIKGEAQALKSEMHRVSEINHALENNNFVLFQQAIVPTGSPGFDQYYEILVRMTNQANEIIPPGLFLPAAERYNLMPAIDLWVVKNYCKWLEANPKQLETLKCVSINLSPATINDTAIVKTITEHFNEHNIPPQKVCFEVTESSAIINMDKTLPLLRSLRDKGFKLALDDFGSGFASYGYLKNLPFTTLKIDGCFIRDIANSHIDKTMVKSMNEVAKALGMTTVAEFVENETILNIINEIGVDFSQGYGIAKPSPLNDLIS